MVLGAALRLGLETAVQDGFGDNVRLETAVQDEFGDSCPACVWRQLFSVRLGTAVRTQSCPGQLELTRMLA